ncbi:carboxypeptidase-like regulatory domain-containing protein [Spirosoma sp. HMF4905]|uniref:Carboxypeptidase-like regulatory domain-containing protein n=1 Tax=Spirosoma arboris TaxID=2682092 RepID=A0A7K1SQU2_9BACT|nr:carboxypeptidase-like regulatory domain-containing protein [Spirosoma arboris]MVM36168.1 carboxypeptidase-like regulatory domain-containing protein [Spirosoma arboris]
MATERIQLAVDTPCQQSWQEMTSTELGRFCAHCQKTVVDFSDLTDKQLIDLLAQSTGSTCGRFRLNQLNRAIQVPVPASPSPRRFFSLLTAGLLGYQTVQAETPPALTTPSTIQIDQNVTSTTELPANNETTLADSLRIITGRVIENTTNTSLAGVNVSLKGTSTEVLTDSAGHFQLQVPTEYQGEQIVIVVAMIGFTTQEIQRRPDQSEPLSIALNEDQKLLGEVIVVGGYKKLSFWQRLRNRLRSGQ